MHKHNAGGQRPQLNSAHALRESEGNLRDIPQSVSLAAMSLQQTENRMFGIQFLFCKLILNETKSLRSHIAKPSQSPGFHRDIVFVFQSSLKT